MGWFTNVVTAVLKRDGEEFTQNTCVYRFPRDVYLSWCQPVTGVEPEGWLSLVDGTLHVQTDYPANPINTVISPVGKTDDPRAYLYNDLVRFGNLGGLFHLVFPPYHGLRLKTVKPFPAYAIPHGNRLALGWICQSESRFSFIFDEVLQENFPVTAQSIKQSVEQGQKIAIEREEELDNIEQLLRRHQGNRRYLELQAASCGMNVPLPLHNELEYAKEQIDTLERKKTSLLRDG